MNERRDLYCNIHKGIRVMLFDLVQMSGRTDYTNADALASLTDEVRDIFDLLESHAHTEDTHVMPLLRAISPQLAKEFTEAHEDQEARLPGLLAALEQLDPVSPAAAAQGHRITLQLARIAGELLTHMSDEELEINPALWDALTDEKLEEVEHTIVSTMAPEKMMRYLRWMFPALNPQEREAFAAVLPPPAREFVATLV